MTIEELAELRELERRDRAANSMTPEEMDELYELMRRDRGIPAADDVLMDELHREEEDIRFGQNEYLEMLPKIFQATVAPLKRVPKVYGEEVSTGAHMVLNAFREDKGLALRVVNGILGGLTFAGAPSTALTRALVGEPLGDLATEALRTVPGLPPGAAETVGGGVAVGAEIAAGLAVPGYVGGAVRAGQSAALRGPRFSAVDALTLERGPRSGVHLGLRTVEGAGRKFRETLPPALRARTPDDALFKPVLKDNVVKEIVDAAEKYAKTGTLQPENTRLFRQITRLLENDELDIPQVLEILKKRGLSVQEFAVEFAETVSHSGRVLQRLSAFRRQVEKTFKDNPEAQKILSDLAAIGDKYQAGWADNIIDAWRNMENFRRGLLVTQIATHMRNITVQTGNLPVLALDDILTAAITGGSSKAGTAREIHDSLSLFRATINRFSKKDRRALEALIDEHGESLAVGRLLSQTTHEVTVGSKLTSVLNIPGRAQEHFFRKLGFEARLRQVLSKRGLDYDTIDHRLITEADLEEAVNYALEMTFASAGKGRLSEMIRGFRDIPGLTTIQPFPRFAYANALPYVINHSPLGFLKAFSPSTLAELGSGNPEKFARAAAKATTGTLMLQTALEIRSAARQDQKWYEVGENNWDMRALAPLSTYLFLAEAILRPDRIQPADWAQAAVGLNRVAGTGLVAVDFLRTKGAEAAQKVLERFVGAYLGSFSIPAKVAQDIYGMIDPEENIRRDMRDNPVVGPFLVNIPEVSQLFPEQPSLTSTEENLKNMNSFFRQMTGLSGKVKNSVEMEMDRLGVDWEVLLPRAKSPETARHLSRYTAEFLEKSWGVVSNAKKYQQAPDSLKKVIMREYIKTLKETATKKLQEEHPDLAVKRKWDDLGADIREAIEEINPAIKKQFDNAIKTLEVRKRQGGRRDGRRNP